MTASQTATIAPLREVIQAQGIGPDQVAGDVVDAIRNDRFWIFTHDETPSYARVRFDDIEAKRNPTSPYEGQQFTE